MQCLSINQYVYIYIYIYILKVKLTTVAEGNQKASFSIASTPRCRGGRYSFSSILPLIRTLYSRVLSKLVSSTILKVFWLTRPGIEPRSLGPLANTLPTWPIVITLFLFFASIKQMFLRRKICYIQVELICNCLQHKFTNLHLKLGFLLSELTVQCKYFQITIDSRWIL